MGILQLARVLHVVIATHFWGYRSKSGISVSEITLGIAGMPNRIDNFNGVCGAARHCCDISTALVRATSKRNRLKQLILFWDKVHHW